MELTKRDEGYTLKKSGHCYAVWKKKRRCENCISQEVLRTHKPQTKLETRESDIYYVLASFIEVDGRPYSLELVKRIKSDDMFERENVLNQLLVRNRQVYMDSVTKVYNRRYYDERLKNLEGRFSFAMIDMDNFKHINDRFGHQAGDAALCVLYIGVDGMLAGENTLVAILSIAIGAILGELLQLDEHMHQLGDWVEQKFGGKGSKTSLSEGFVTASLLFCVGAMAIMGALDSGLTGDHSTLYAKALLDGIISVVYASTLGIGVALSAIPIFLYQGAIALGASFLAPYLTEAVILEMKCVGSILILGLSLNMLGLTKIKVMNYVPAVFLPILLCRFL